MTKEELIGLLNADLANELKHMMFYLHCSSVVQGLHREEFSEMWLDHAQSEMRHVSQFSKMIVGLGGTPNTWVINGFPQIADPQGQVEYALAMEDEVVANYVQRLKDAADLGGVDGTFVGLFIEEQIVDSRTDADEFREMVKQPK